MKSEWPDKPSLNLNNTLEVQKHTFLEECVNYQKGGLSDNSVCSALSNIQSYYITDIKTLKNPQSTLENDIINSSGCQIKSKSDVNQRRPIPASLLL